MTPMTQGERKRQSSNAATRTVEAIDSALHVAAYGVGRLAREHGGSGGQQSRAARVGSSKCLPDCRIDCVLTGNVQTAGTSSGQNQRAVVPGCEPHAVHAPHLAGPDPVPCDREESAGGVGGAELLQQRRR